MKKFTHFVGLDVHKDTIAIGLARGSSREAPESLGGLVHDVPKLVRKLLRLGPAGRVLCAYEAGPTGYGLYRALLKRGIACEVIAPSKIPVQSGDRIKTDRRDALKLARLLRAGELTAIHVPEGETEAMRDLMRARGDAVKARQAARQQLSKFLLRHSRTYTGKTTWTQTHLEWIRGQTFEFAAQQTVLVDYLRTVEQLNERLHALEQHVEELVPKTKLAPTVAALQALRGIGLVSAAVLAFEIADFRRFKSAGHLMSYLGLVPSERSSGQSTRRGPSTKAGNSHVRRVLVEAAWNYRFPPRKTRDLLARSKELPQAVRDTAWKGQLRLNRRYKRMLERKRSPQCTIVAMARELVGFVWAIGQQSQPQAA